MLKKFRYSESITEYELKVDTTKKYSLKGKNMTKKIICIVITAVMLMIPICVSAANYSIQSVPGVCPDCGGVLDKTCWGQRILQSVEECHEPGHGSCSLKIYYSRAIITCGYCNYSDVEGWHRCYYEHTGAPVSGSCCPIHN